MPRHSCVPPGRARVGDSPSDGVLAVTGRSPRILRVLRGTCEAPGNQSELPCRTIRASLWDAGVWGGSPVTGAAPVTGKLRAPFRAKRGRCRPWLTSGNAIKLTARLCQ
ncbi:MAG: hypothetical protein HBSAPP03_01340 [Phycisphaerae bacterium]|nr:MAG: hypothetical protein HBSAPP03_01340 [Phycisphaerae bacterium]